MWYSVGTVTYKKGSNTLTGKDTTWADNKLGISPGDLVLVSTNSSVMMAEIDTIQSDTSLTLRNTLQDVDITNAKYSIISTLSESLPEFSKRISAAILYFNQQADAFKVLDEKTQKQIADLTAKVVNYYTKAESDGKYALKAASYTKAESDGRYYAKGGNLAFSSLGKTSNLGIGSTDLYWQNTKSGKTLQLKDDGRLTYSDKDIYHADRKPTLDELGAAGNDMGKWFNLSTKGLPEANWYPICIVPDRNKMPFRFSIQSESRGGADPWNRCQFSGVLSASGWSDTPFFLYGYYHNYDSKERTIAGIYSGKSSYYGTIIYVRGGNQYLIESPVEPILYKAQVTLGDNPSSQTVLPVGPVVDPTNVNLLLDCNTANPGFHVPHNASHFNKIQTPQDTAAVSLAIGDNDSGLGFRADGAVNIWSNASVKGYWDVDKLVYNKFVSTNADGMRLVYGNKGFLLRQDGSNMYFLLSTDSSGYGGWTAHRPMTINMGDGTTSFGCPTHLNGATYFGSTQYLKKTSGAVYESTMRLWGAGERQSVVEWGWGGLPYAMYIERNSGLANNQSKFQVNGQIAGQVVNTSDERLKHNVQKVENALEIVEQLNGYTFQYNETDVPSAGVLAQELLGVYDNAVFVGNNPNNQEDTDDYYTVDYNQLHALHIESIKELSGQNKILTNTVNALMGELENLREELYNMKVNGVSSEAPPINTEETP